MREKINSMTNSKIKQAAGLQNRKKREKEGLFVAEGIRLAEMAVESSWNMVYALYMPDMGKQPRGQALLERLEHDGCPLYEVPGTVYRKASGTDTPQGILLVMEQQRYSLSELPVREAPLYVILDGVQDPGNAGTIIRTADAAGADAVILLRGTVDVFGEKAVRSSMGSLFHIPVCMDVAAEDLLDFSAQRNMELLSAALDEHARPYWERDFRPGCAIVFGNEGSGVTDSLLARTEHLYIPMYGRAESLNVGSSASILLYEAIRQRRYSSQQQ